MAKQQLKPKDKVVVRMTRDGAVEENLTAGTEKRVSGRPEDAELVKPVETDAPSEGISAEEQKKVQMRSQQRQFQAEHAEDSNSLKSYSPVGTPRKIPLHNTTDKRQRILGVGHEKRRSKASFSVYIVVTLFPIQNRQNRRHLCHPAQSPVRSIYSLQREA